MKSSVSPRLILIIVIGNNLMSHVHFVDSVESTALRLITGLGSSEVQPQLSRFSSEPKQVQKLFQYQTQLVFA